MNTDKISPDDPRLTAYALDEMGEIERVEFERLLAHDADARAVVAEIRQAGKLFVQALEDEPVTEVASAPVAPITSKAERSGYERRFVGFPYWRVSGLAAACFAVAFVVWEYQRPDPVKVRRYQVIDLAAAPEPGSGTEAPSTNGDIYAEGDSLRRVRDRVSETRVADSRASVAMFLLEGNPSAYANMREAIQAGRRPVGETVDVAGMVNYFPYASYAAPAGDAPFAANLEVAGAPWAEERRLVRIGIRGRDAQGMTAGDKDVAVRVRFNPALVQAYRVVGYENSREEAVRGKSAGEVVGVARIGANDAVTALYEVVPVGIELPATEGMWLAFDGVNYTRVAGAATGTGIAQEMLTVSISYAEPTNDVRTHMEFVLRDTGAAFAQATPDFKFAASVAAFGLALKDSPMRSALALADVAKWARQGVDEDSGGRRAEFLTLLDRASQVMQ